MVMNTFVALRHISILSKEEMFEINQTLIRKIFKRAGVNARAMFNIKIFKDSQNSSFLIVFFSPGVKLCIFSLLQEI